MYRRFLKGRGYRDKYDVQVISEFLNTYNNASTYNLYRQAIKDYYFAKNAGTEFMEFKMNKAFKAVRRRKPHVAKRHGQHWYTKDEIEGAADAVSPKYSVIIRALFWTGCRISELRNIELRDCRNGKDPVAIRILGKGFREREVFLPEDIYKRARKLFQGGKYLFESKYGEQYSRTTISKEMQRQARKKCGLNLHAHTLRHSKAMYLLQIQKMSPDKIARALGHADVTTTLSFYLHGTPGPEEQGMK